jgi:hypothetical protein
MAGAPFQPVMRVDPRACCAGEISMALTHPGLPEGSFYIRFDHPLVGAKTYQADTCGAPIQP